MTTIRTRCDVCRLDSDQPPSEVAIYDGLDQNHFMVLFQCLECGEYNRQEIQLEKAQILISAGVIHISVLDVAELLLDDDHGIERELSAWAEEIH